jgi:endonuclease YncB( thermonuclease family)
MKRALIVLTGLLLATPAIAAPGDPDTWKAAGAALVVDGDTIKLRGVTVRMEGIDAPEARQPCMLDRAPWACGEAAKQFLVALIDGREVTCRGRGADRYGRQLATCWAGPQLNLNATMVLAGYALAYRQYSAAYVSEEDAARRERAGIWRTSFQPPWEWRRDARAADARPKGSH